MRVLICFLFSLAALPALAQEKPIPPEAFLNEAESRTLTFVMADDGSLVGIERFLGRDRTVWTQPTGRCAYGLVELRGPLLCFTYEDDAPGVEHCWTTFRLDDRLHVRSTLNGEVQRVEAITRDYVGCEGEPLS
ncbi:hypothetical protein [Jannaschia aquimarina]|nr:hypothetical protein [Jannaschia aquimarina]